MYSQRSLDIEVSVEPEFVSKEFSGDHYYYIYSYSVSVTNHGPTSCQLLSRHWIIRDGNGHEEHVIGDGVVGKQPIIRSGETFKYTSGCPLVTPTGNMRGKYYMLGPDNYEFEVRIPLFFLRPQDKSIAAGSRNAPNTSHLSPNT
ncbi:MAG: Co2+/Mg2+ efflux protein ApaG [Pseudobacteriovorax sp.]|nr:Co2+/Mg2+ efflux protein ApaG [Pseudobacteriovorax sp.]